MRTEKIIIEVIWRPTEQKQNWSILADEFTRAIEEVLEEEELDGAAFALPMGR